MCRSEYRGGFRRGLLMSHGTDSVRTNLAGSVGIKTARWEFKYHFGFILECQESTAQTPPPRPTPKTGKEFAQNQSCATGVALGALGGVLCFVFFIVNLLLNNNKLQ